MPLPAFPRSVGIIYIRRRRRSWSRNVYSWPAWLTRPLAKKTNTFSPFPSLCGWLNLNSGFWHARRVAGGTREEKLCEITLIADRWKFIVNRTITGGWSRDETEGEAIKRIGDVKGERVEAHRSTCWPISLTIGPMSRGNRWKWTVSVDSPSTEGFFC